MSDWEKLAEARIREWLGRPPHERLRPWEEGPATPLETQLLDQALELAQQAHELPEGPERKAVERRAASVETPLAAQRIGELLIQAKARLAAKR